MKKLLAILLVFTLVLSLAACSGNKGSDSEKKAQGQSSETSKNQQAQSNTQTQGAKSPSNEMDKDRVAAVGEEILLEGGKYIGMVQDITFLSDIDGKPVINVKYNVSNHSEEEKVVIDMFVMKAVQDGQDLNMAVLSAEDEDPNRVADALTAVAPGENSGLDETAFLLNSDSDVTIVITTIDDAFNGKEYKIIVPVPKG